MDTIATMFSPIEDILQDLRNGRMAVLVDAEDRENEGDIVLPAEFVTPDAINFMLKAARGYLCLSLTERDCDRLDLHPQTSVNTSVRGTPLTVSIDGHPDHGFTTGVSAHERARAIRMAIDPRYGSDDFVRPGHINPLRSRDGGVLVRTGQTEGSVDLCRLAGLYPAAIIIEVMREDGEMARVPDLEALCAEHGLKMCTVGQVIEHRLARERLVHRIPPIEGTPIETEEGTFTLIAYESVVDALPQVALTMGGVGVPDSGSIVPESSEPTLVRMHRRNFLGDIFGAVDSSADGATSRTLRASLRAIREAGRGALVYLRPEGVGDGLQERLTAIRRDGEGSEDAPSLRAPGGIGSNAVPMHLRETGIGCQILRDLGLRRLRVLTNTKKSLPGVDAFGLEIIEQVPLRAGRE